MFTLFRPELASYAAARLAEHRAYEQGTLTADITALRTARLQDTVRAARHGSPFYAARLADWDDAAVAGLTLDRLPELPLTTKEDLRGHGWDLASQPLHEAWVYYETTGTTGPPTPCPRDERDSIVNNLPLTLRYGELFARHGRDHVVAVMGPTELHSTGDTFGDVLRNLGHTVVKMWPQSPLVGSQRALTLLDDLRVTALVCTPGTAIALARQALASGRRPERSAVRLLLTLGELTTPALLAAVGGLWGATAYNCMYASQEASILAACTTDGALETLPLNNCYELLGSDGSPQDLHSDGKPVEGELVVTHLYQGSKPLVRYRTGDLVRAVPAPDPRRAAAGAWTVTPVGRARDRLVLQGREVCAYDLETAVLARVRGCLDYQLVIDTGSAGDVLTVRLEMADPDALLALDTAAVRDHVVATLGVETVVEVADADGLSATGAMVSWKAARLHDRRGEPDPEREAALAVSARRAVSA